MYTRGRLPPATRPQDILEQPGLSELNQISQNSPPIQPVPARLEYIRPNLQKSPRKIEPYTVSQNSPSNGLPQPGLDTLN